MEEHAIAVYRAEAARILTPTAGLEPQAGYILRRPRGNRRSAILRAMVAGLAPESAVRRTAQAAVGLGFRIHRVHSRKVTMSPLNVVVVPVIETEALACAAASRRILLWLSRRGAGLEPSCTVFS